MPEPTTAALEHLVRAIEADFVGPFDGPDELLPLPPSRWYLGGFLAPQTARDTGDPTDQEHLTAGADATDEEASADERAPRQRRFMADNWPFGELVPTLWYDPRTACPGPPWVSLHAKCAVVDRRLALMTSANFTERGQTRNLEAGVLIDDVAFASRLCDHWQRLVVAGSVVRAN